MSVLENYYQLVNNIAKVAYRCGRNPADIDLLVVTKERAWEEFNCLYHAGIRDFGENRLQEAEQKISSTPEDIRWHFIGPLQKNKVRKIVQSFDLIHSVDSLDLAQKISICSLEEDQMTRVLLQVNTSGEESKQGFTEEEVKKDFETLWELPGIKVEGFMTMAPFTDDELIIRKCFHKLWNIRDEFIIHSGGAISLPHLSMGMSNDYPLAILEGATILRIGSALFE